MNYEWVRTLDEIMSKGQFVKPRGKSTFEIPQHTVTVPMRTPVLTVPERKLSYRFMAAEAYWILSGDNTVVGIAPWNSRIAAFSDDGETFFGAYGPKVVDQLPYVVKKLQEDPESRQAGLTIWRESPGPTKDVPCTIAIFATIRNGRLNLSVFMRSSDAWLGLPYDIFNFSMLGHLICCQLNAADGTREISPGLLRLTAASCHLYEEHWGISTEIISLPVVFPGRETPEVLFHHSAILMDTLGNLRDSSVGDPIRWWEPKDEA
jgi:thymidylate synthase